MWVEGLEARRLLAVLRLDPGFAGDGRVEAPSDTLLSVIGFQPDGRPIVREYNYKWPSATYSFTRLHRMNQDGSYDPTYDGGPVVQGSEEVRGPVELDRFGRAFFTRRTLEQGKILLYRVNADGDLDSKFGRSGKIYFQMPASPRAGYRVSEFQVADFAFDDQARPYLLLQVWTRKSTQSYPTRQDLAIVRLSPSGRVDPTFGTDGMAVVTAEMLYGERFQINVNPDGSVLAVGQNHLRELAVQKFTPDGILDTTFGNGGAAPAGTFRATFGPYPITVNNPDDIPILRGFDGRGGIIVTDFKDNEVGTFKRITPDGQMDTDFGQNGTLAWADELYPYFVGVDPQGNLMFRNNDNSLGRATPDGKIDTSFGVDGLSHALRDVSGFMDDGLKIDALGQFWLNTNNGDLCRAALQDNIHLASKGRLYLTNDRSGEAFEIERTTDGVVIRRNGAVVRTIAKPIKQVIADIDWAGDEFVSTAGLAIRMNDARQHYDYTAAYFDTLVGADRVAVRDGALDLGNAGGTATGYLATNLHITAREGVFAINFTGPFSYSEPNIIADNPLLTLRLTGGRYSSICKYVNTDVIVNTTFPTGLNFANSNDLIIGGDQVDNWTIGAGRDSIYSGGGDDTITVRGARGSRVFSGTGNDQVIVRESRSISIETGSGDDVIKLYTSGHVVAAGKGRDTVYAGNSGADTLDGGDGNDLAYRDDALDVLTSVERVE